MIRQMIIRWVMNSMAIAAAAYLISGISYDSIGDLIIAAALFGVLNTFLKPLLLLLTLPINILSLGLFTFVVNAIMLGLTGAFLSGFYVAGFWSALAGAVVISIVSVILNKVLEDDRRP